MVVLINTAAQHHFSYSLVFSIHQCYHRLLYSYSCLWKYLVDGINAVDKMFWLILWRKSNCPSFRREMIELLLIIKLLMGVQLYQNNVIECFLVFTLNMVEMIRENLQRKYEHKMVSKVV